MKPNSTAALKRELIRMGVDIKTLQAAEINVKTKVKPVRITRIVIKRLQKLLRKDGEKAVVTYSGGAVRVWSMDGYQALVKNAQAARNGKKKPAARMVHQKAPTAV